MGSLTERQKAIIVGCLLGDGRLECRSTKKTARLRIHHADSQKNYLLWKYDEFKNLTTTKPKRHEYIDKRNNKKVISWYFHTRTLRALRRFFCQFYKNNRKIIPTNLETTLTPLTLATWIMDDGCFYKDTLILNTQSFFFYEQEFLRDVFKKKFGIESGIQKDRKNFRLYFSKKATKKVKDLISPFMKFKLSP